MTTRMRLSDILLISDLDGTLLSSKWEISAGNKEALRRFRELGGSFTLASGRSPCQLRKFAEELEITLPVIVNNGAAIYDYRGNRVLWSRCLPGSFREIIAKIHSEFPEMGIAAVTDADENFVLWTSQTLRNMIEWEQWTYTIATVEQLPDNVCKVLFLLDGLDDDLVMERITANSGPDVELVYWGGFAFEMMAKGVTKGDALRHLAALCQKPMDHTVAIGDHNNDVDSIRQAALGVAVKNALDHVKAVASLQVASCDEDGVAELVHYLIANSDKL